MLKYFFASAIVEPRLTQKEIEKIKEQQLKDSRKTDEKLTPKTTKMYSFV
jgi:hypothetical protein